MQISPGIKSIVFIDSRITDYLSLIDSLPSSTEVFILDSHSDGLDQILARLDDSAGFDAIHVISHGSPGALYLGSTLLNSDNLSAYSLQLASIGHSLSQTGDILLYGCSVAQGGVGLRFINSLSSCTKADVAASTDATGATTWGGDWVLEESVGHIEALTLQGGSLIGTLSIGTGKVTTDFGLDVWGGCAAIQADGKILVVGTARTAAYYDFALTRYNKDGSLDSTFGSSGKTVASIGPLEAGYTVKLQSDGKILVAGTTRTTDSNDFALIRFNTDGSLDGTFGQGGIVTTDVGSGTDDSATSVVVLGDGKIVVAGMTSNSPPSYDFVLVKYNSDGSMDGTFGNVGKTITDIGSKTYDYAYSATLQADGKIVLAGTTTTGGLSHFSLARYTSSGTLDTTFASAGKLIDAEPNCQGISVKVQADGKILVAGYGDGATSSDFAIARYNINGTLDASFGTAGRLRTDVGFNSVDYGASVTTQADGKILVAGTADSEFALVRYNTDGSIDRSFGVDGKVTTDFGGSQEAVSVTVQADGKILLTGNANIGGSSAFALARYNSDGNLDTQFGAVSPIATIFSPTDEARDVPVDTNIIVTFSESIAVGSGTIVLKTIAGITVASYDAATSTSLSISGNTLTIDPTFDLAYDSGYKVEFSFGSVKDLFGNNYLGSAEYNFSTGAAPDTGAPVITAFSPVDESIAATVSSNIVFGFDEFILRGVGAILLKTIAGSTVAAYDVATSGNLTVTGNTLTLNPTADLSIFTTYKVEISPGAIKDLAGNAFAGLSDYNFTTQTVDGLYHFFVVAFAAAPGVEYMNQFAEAWNYGLTLQQIVNIFTTKHQFTDVYPESLTNAQLTTQLVDNIVKASLKFFPQESEFSL